MPRPERHVTAEHEIWPPRVAAITPEWPMPGWGATIRRGVMARCPHCAMAPIFDGYLKVFDTCIACGAPLGAMPADDTPPYIAMLVVLHVAGVLIVLGFRLNLSPSPWEYGALLAMLIAVCLIGLRMAKGAVIGILLKLGQRRGRLP